MKCQILLFALLASALCCLTQFGQVHSTPTTSAQGKNETACQECIETAESLNRMLEFFPDSDNVANYVLRQYCAHFVKDESLSKLVLRMVDDLKGFVSIREILQKVFKNPKEGLCTRVHAC